MAQAELIIENERLALEAELARQDRDRLQKQMEQEANFNSASTEYVDIPDVNATQFRLWHMVLILLGMMLLCCLGCIGVFWLQKRNRQQLEK